MDPHPEKIPGLGLPQPSMKQSTTGFGRHYAHGREIHPITMESSPPPILSDPSAALVPPVLNTAQQAGIVDVAVDSSSALATQTDNTTSDDTSDALDEEWIDKAKAIVERTKDDPYLESKELSRAKANYLQLRYNKRIKIAEEQH